MQTLTSPVKERKLVIVGDSAFAEIAYEYFTHDSPYQVVGFSVEQAYLQKKAFWGLPVVPFEEIASRFAPADHDIFVAITYPQLNRLRERLFKEAKVLGYGLASYVSSQAFVWHNVKLGEHCFIFENNVVQPFVTLGANVILWSGNHIGHHSTIGDHCFISSHVVVSGFVAMGSHCFAGVNATISNNVTIAPDCWIGPGSIIVKDTEPGAFYKATRTDSAQVSTYRYFKVPQEAGVSSR
jgi:sugar O-acyltransferase (sialic acid O-acetyltransferase NeuD family)